MRKLFFPLAAALVLTAASIFTAHAHSSLETGAAKLGGYKAVIKIPHGCDGQATNAVRVEIPEGYVGAKPMPKAGWTLDIEKGDYAKTYKIHGKDIASGLKIVTWSGGDLPDDFYDEFILSGTLADLEPRTKLPFITTQICKDGKVEWKDVAKDGEDPHALEHPAPLLEIIAGEDEHAGHNMASMSHDAAPVAVALSEPVTFGSLKITGFWAKAMLPGQPTGAAYLTVENTGTDADRLMSVQSPVSPKVQIHEMKMDGDVMKMRLLADGMEIPAGGKIEFSPGSNHLMFNDMNEPFKEGATITILLHFEKAGEVEITLPVLPANWESVK